MINSEKEKGPFTLYLRAVDELAEVKFREKMLIKENEELRAKLNQPKTLQTKQIEMTLPLQNCQTEKKESKKDAENKPVCKHMKEMNILTEQLNDLKQDKICLQELLDSKLKTLDEYMLQCENQALTISDYEAEVKKLVKEQRLQRKAFRRKLKKMRLSLGTQVSDLTNQNKNLHEDCKNHEISISKLEKMLQDLTAEIKKLKKEADRLQNIIITHENDYSDLKTEFQRKENEFMEGINARDQEIIRLRTLLTQSERKNEDLIAKRDIDHDKLLDAEIEIDLLSKMIQQLNIDMSDKTCETNTLQKDQVNSNMQLQDVKNQLDHLKKQLDDVNNQLTNVKMQLRHTKNELDVTCGLLKATSEELKISQDNCSQLVKETNQAENEMLDKDLQTKKQLCQMEENLQKLQKYQDTVKDLKQHLSDKEREVETSILAYEHEYEKRKKLQDTVSQLRAKLARVHDDLNVVGLPAHTTAVTLPPIHPKQIECHGKTIAAHPSESTPRAPPSSPTRVKEHETKVIPCPPTPKSEDEPLKVHSVATERETGTYRMRQEKKLQETARGLNAKLACAPKVSDSELNRVPGPAFSTAVPHPPIPTMKTECHGRTKTSHPSPPETRDRPFSPVRVKEHGIKVIPCPPTPKSEDEPLKLHSVAKERDIDTHRMASQTEPNKEKKLQETASELNFKLTCAPKVSDSELNRVPGPAFSAAVPHPPIPTRKTECDGGTKTSHPSHPAPRDHPFSPVRVKGHGIKVIPCSPTPKSEDEPLKLHSVATERDIDTHRMAYETESIKEKKLQETASELNFKLACAPKVSDSKLNIVPGPAFSTAVPHPPVPTRKTECHGRTKTSHPSHPAPRDHPFSLITVKDHETKVIPRPPAQKSEDEPLKLHMVVKDFKLDTYSMAHETELEKEKKLQKTVSELIATIKKVPKVYDSELKLVPGPGYSTSVSHPPIPTRKTECDGRTITSHPSHPAPRDHSFSLIKVKEHVINIPPHPPTPKAGGGLLPAISEKNNHVRKIIPHPPTPKAGGGPLPAMSEKNNHVRKIIRHPPTPKAGGGLLPAMSEKNNLGR